MENKTIDNAILNKIQKLINLSQKNSNLNESANAFAAAQELLSKHRLSMADVMGKEVEATEINTKNLEQDSRRVTHWRSDLCSGIARLNQCRMIIFTHPRVSFKLIGTTQDIEIVEYLYNSVATQIEEFSQQALSAGLGSGKSFSNNFKFGAVETVLNRLKKAKQDAQQEFVSQHATSTALVVLENQIAAVNKYIENTYKLRNMQSSPSQYNPNARDLGRQAGHRVSLNPGLKNSSTGKLIK